MNTAMRLGSATPAPSEIRLRSATGRAVVAAAVLGSALAYMSDDMLNVAIPAVATDLGGTVHDVQWVVNSYYVTLVSWSPAPSATWPATAASSGPGWRCSPWGQLAAPPPPRCGC